MDSAAKTCGGAKTHRSILTGSQLDDRPYACSMTDPTLDDRPHASSIDPTRIC
ncbi:MAG: hypothetical protein ACR2OB_14785 [Solirubrobacteraceae bacterium]